MMRGNRQGNNAFLEDPVHEYQTPGEYLMKNPYCLENAFRGDFVEEDTFKTLKKGLGDEQFFQLTEKLIPILMRQGGYNGLLYLFKLMWNPEQQ